MRATCIRGAAKEYMRQGTLLGKFFLGKSTPEVAFAGDGRLVILTEFSIFVAHVVAKAAPHTYP